MLDTDPSRILHWPRAAPHPHVGPAAPNGIGDQATNALMSLVQTGRKEDSVGPLRFEVETSRQLACVYTEYPQRPFVTIDFQVDLDF